MDSNHHLPTVVENSPFKVTIREKVESLYESTKNPLSLFSGAAFIFAMVFLSTGLYVFAVTRRDEQFPDEPYMHNPTVPFIYFGSALAIAVIFALAYSSCVNRRAKHNRGRIDSGLITGRQVVRGIATLSSLCFLVAGFQILSLEWSWDWHAGVYCLAAIPATCMGFAFVYGRFLCQDQDIKPSDGARHGSGRKTIVQLGVLSTVASIYLIWKALRTFDPTLIWGALAFFVISLTVCLGTHVVFTERVSKSQDRGVAEG